MPESLKDQYATTPLAGGNAGYVEALYEQYLSDPQSVPADWRKFFSETAPTGAAGNGRDVAHGPIRAAVLARARAPRVAAQAPAVADSAKQGAVSRMIQLYVNRGHLIANLDPLGMTKRPVPQ
jgi:2-oxoglutarate dehydrogenase E1 component